MLAPAVTTAGDAGHNEHPTREPFDINDCGDNAGLASLVGPLG
jgi:hypothetical protein